MYMPVAPQREFGGHIDTLRAMFYTDELTLTAEIASPDTRLSDYLNSSLSTLDIRPILVRWNRTGSSVDLSAPHAILEKDHVLFVTPIAEPLRYGLSDSDSRRRMATLPCWASLGPYTLTGMIYLDAERDPRTALRLLDKQFLPLTEVTLATASDEVREYGALIVNRKHLDMLALTSLGEASQAVLVVLYSWASGRALRGTATGRPFPISQRGTKSREHRHGTAPVVTRTPIATLLITSVKLLKHLTLAMHTHILRPKTTFKVRDDP